MTLERSLDPEVREAAIQRAVDIYDELGAKVMFYRTIEIYGATGFGLCRALPTPRGSLPKRDPLQRKVMI